MKKSDYTINNYKYNIKNIIYNSLNNNRNK